MAEDQYDIPEDELREKYAETGSMQACARHFGCSGPTIRNRLNRYNIPIENRHGGGHNSRAAPTVYENQSGYLIAQCSTDQKRVGIHQLTAIADGADPYKVFSGGEWVVHHISQYKLDNRPGNLLVTKPGMHENIHNADWLLKDGSDKEVHAFLELADMRGNIDRLRGALDDLEE